MKLLEHIRLIQFYLLEKQDVRFDRVTGLFGINGSGKSSVLDAVQIALFGGNGNYVTLNAQADERASTRSIRGYCLGQYGGGESDYVRDAALTYITLVWRDTSNGEPLSMGVCLSASSAREGHEVLGRYVLPGVDLAMSDHLEMVDGEERPRDWAAFRHQLLESGRNFGNDPLFTDADRFMKAYLLALRGSAGSAPPEAFRRAFRFGLRMRFDRSIDEIVRDQVLEARPTEIRKFKEVTESFRRLTELVALVEQKINDGDAVEREFTRAASEARRVATWMALAADVALEGANSAHDDALRTRNAASDALDVVTNEIATTTSNLQHARDEAQRVKQLRERHAAHAQHGLAQSQIEEKTALVERSRTELERSLGFISRLTREAAESSYVPQSSPSLQRALNEFEVWNADPTRHSRELLRSTVKPVLAAIRQAIDEVFQTRSGIERDLESAKNDVAHLEENLRRVAEGLTVLSPHVQQLMRELRDQGLSPTPICDLVRITDAEWQPAIEAYLSPHLQALLVPAAQEQQAFAVYRSLKGPRAVYGAKIVIESHHRDTRSAGSGTVAELIDGSAPAAVAYLRAQLGDTRRAESDQDALGARRSLTKDGMLVRGGAMERLRLVEPQDFRVGAKGGREKREELLRDLGKRRAALSKLQMQQQAARELWNRLVLLGGEDEVLRRLLESFDAMRAARADIETLRQALSGAADAEYVRLGEEEREWLDRVKTLAEMSTKLAEAKGRAGEALTQCHAAETKAAEAVAAALERSRAAREDPEFDSDLAAKQWDVLLEKHSADSAAMRIACDNTVRAAETQFQRLIREGSNRLTEFVLKYREHLPSEARDVQDVDSWRKAADWLRHVLARLRNTELQNYKQEMQEAYAISRATFRNDVAMKLYENLERLNDTMAALNEVLRTCPVFSNGERYHFVRRPRPQFQSLLKFIKDIGAQGPEEDLLGGVEDLPEQFRQLLEEKTMVGALGTKSPLDDYREFFEFDIEIQREDPITHVVKPVTMLSKRLGPGSGGEHRAPLYVIAGAALASAYRLGREADDGLRLILIDEAFNKMDSGNIIATMRYLEDLGLQIVLASPGDNLGVLTPFLYRYYDMTRDPAIQVMDFAGHDVTVAARELLRSDLAEFHPELLDQELAAMTREMTATTTGIAAERTAAAAAD